jgi:hypothetical protein
MKKSIGFSEKYYEEQKNIRLLLYGYEDPEKSFRRRATACENLFLYYIKNYNRCAIL